MLSSTLATSFNTDPVLRYRLMAGLGAVLMFAAASARHLAGEDGAVATRILCSTACALFAIFAHRTDFIRNNAHAVFVCVCFTLLAHLVLMSVLSSLAPEMAVSTFFLLAVISAVMESRQWMRLQIFVWGLTLVVAAWLIPTPQMSPLTYSIVLIVCGVALYIIADSVLATRNMLRAKDLQLEASQRFSGVGSWEIDTATLTCSWSSTTRAILGVPDDFEATRDLSRFLVGPQNEHPIYQAINHLLTTGEPFDIVGEMQTYEGRRMWIHSRGQTMAEVGHPERTMGVFSDITATVEHERELTAAKEAAEAAALARTQFLANMSHEIRTPMNGVIGTASLLNQSNLAPQDREYLRVIRSCSESLLTIINDVLDFAKIDAGKLDIHKRTFDLVEMVRDATDAVSFTATDKGLALRFDPSSLTFSNVMGDEPRLRQILTNLLSNAVKFTPEGSVDVKITAAHVHEQYWDVTFAVADTGIGIDNEALDGLFDAFTQADASTTRRFGGTGLGLTISQELVKLMGGQLTVESVPGEGSTFAFTLRMQVPPAAQATDDVREPADATTGEARLLHDLRVLVAEDNLVNQRVVSKMLERLGIHATLVADGREALAAVGQQSFDVVLMDVQMPHLDGIGATREIRRLECLRQPYIVALTANAMAEDEGRCRDAGMDAFLAKPIRLADLAETLEATYRRP